MALLTATQGTPHRVWSLLQFLDARDGQLSREEVSQWMNPVVSVEGNPTQSDQSHVNQTIEAAAGLGLIERDASTITLSLQKAPESAGDLADEVFLRLVQIDLSGADSVVFEALALVLVKSNLENARHWASEVSRTKFADFLRDTLGPGHDGKTSDRFNETKFAPWRRWVEFLGLWRELPFGVSQPVLTKRMAILIAGSGLPKDSEIEANEFVSFIAKAMPFVDGGSLHKQACERLGLPSAKGDISNCVSMALRELDSAGKIKLIRRGDAPGGVSLTTDRYSSIKTFHAATIAGESDNHE